MAPGARAQSATGGTRAGTVITNVAALRYTSAGQPQSVPSNEATIIVAERLDVQLARAGQGPVTVGPDPTPVAVTLTNTGNGEESFAVAATVTSGIAVVRTLVIDSDGDGLYDPARDTALTNGTTPVLQPGQAIALLVILSAPDTTDTAAGTLNVTARATTGSGPAGQAYAGQGDGGGDAVVGSTGAAATVAVPIATTAAGAAPTLIKSQSVLAADGSATPFRDAVITYTLEARFPSALDAARVDDPVPAGTTYVPGSLTLDGAALSDAADADPGQFDAGTGAIGVALTGIAAGTTHTVQFKAKIQ